MKNQQKQIKILITPDKFRGSLSAEQVCSIVQSSLLQISSSQQYKFKYSHINLLIEKAQLADGGQGSLYVLSKSLRDVQYNYIQANDPLMRKIKTKYLINKKQKITYVQMAQISGLSLLEKNQRNPMKTTTFGVGEIVLDALLKQKCQKIYLFIGGSATNDGGIGMANALGYKFLNNKGQQLDPTGQNLIHINKIILPQKQIIQLIKKTDIIILSDVQNVFYGLNGAAYVYGPQKGASQEMVKQLDLGLQNLNQIINKQFNIDLSSIKGSGAAGGLGGGAIVFLKGKIKSGIQEVLDIIQFDRKVEQADLIITGQGKIDRQSLQGKVIFGVLKRVKSFKKPLWILCGVNQLKRCEQECLFEIHNLIKIISLVQWPQITRQIAIEKANQILRSRVKQNFVSFLKEKSYN